MISHEWSHTELVKRLNVTFGAREIPSWFDEGVAVIVSNDIRHNAQAWNKIIKRKLAYPKMDELITLRDWIKAVGKYQKNVDSDEVVVIYATAGHVVNQLYQQRNAKDLANLIEGVKNGSSFLELYNDI